MIPVLTHMEGEMNCDVAIIVLDDHILSGLHYDQYHGVVIIILYHTTLSYI